MLRRLDPTRSIALRTSMTDLPEGTEANLLAVAGRVSDITGVAARVSKPILAWCEDGKRADADAFSDALAERRAQLASVPNLAGIVV